LLVVSCQLPVASGRPSGAAASATNNPQRTTNNQQLLMHRFAPFCNICIDFHVAVSPSQACRASRRTIAHQKIVFSWCASSLRQAQGRPADKRMRHPVPPIFTRTNHRHRPFYCKMRLSITRMKLTTNNQPLTTDQ